MKNLLSIIFLLFICGLSVKAQASKEILEEKLALAVAHGNIEQIKSLLDQKVSPNARDAFNQPAILLAFRTNGSKDKEKVKEIVEILVEAGANLNVRNEFGVTPYLLAEVYDYLHPEKKEGNILAKKFADYLVSKGAQPAKDKYGRNGLMHFHGADTGETLPEQIWRQLIEGYPELISSGEIREVYQTRFAFNQATLLMAAVYYGDLKTFSSITERAVPVDNGAELDKDGNNVFFYMARANNVVFPNRVSGYYLTQKFKGSTEEKLIQETQSLNKKYLEVKNQAGETPFEVALKMDAQMFITYFYTLNRKVNEFDNEGLTPIFQSIKRKHYAVLRFLISALGANPDLPGKTGNTPLNFAAENDDVLATLILLINKRKPLPGTSVQKVKGLFANVNQPNSEGKTALMIAAEKGNSEIVKTLLRYGADVFLKGKNGETALGLARQNRRSAVVYRLSALTKSIEAPIISPNSKPIQSNSTTTPLMVAAQKGDLVNLEKLIKAGTNIDETDSDGKTALFYAILNDEIYAVDWLIKAGANVNHLAKGAVTPLMAAARYKNDLSIPLLLKAGAKINEQDKFGKTALMWATEGDNETTAEVLKGKPDLTIKDNKGSTALIQTLEKEWIETEIIKMLLNSGANPSETNGWKETALHLAIKNSYFELILPMLKAGANPYQKGGVIEADAFRYLDDKWSDNTLDENTYQAYKKLMIDNKLPKYKP